MSIPYSADGHVFAWRTSVHLESVDKLDDARFELIKPIPAVVTRSAEGNSWVARLVESTSTAMSGETVEVAVAGLTSYLTDLYDLYTKDRDRLGVALRHELSVLEKYVRHRQ